MKKRIASLLLACVLLLTLLTPAVAAPAQGAGEFVLAAVTAGGVIIPPCRIAYTAGQTVAQALQTSGHTFAGAEEGFVDAIDGVSGSYRRYNSAGGFSLQDAASSVTAFIFVEGELADAAAYCAMAEAIVAWGESAAPVRNYAAAEHDAAVAALCDVTAAHGQLAASLRQKMADYETEVAGAQKHVLALGFADLQGAPLAGWFFTAVNDYGAACTFTENETPMLAAGDYTFCLHAGDNGARGAMTVTSDGTVRIAGSDVSALRAPAGQQWLQAPVLHKTGSAAVTLETDKYSTETDASGHTVRVYVPDTVSGSLYAYCDYGSDVGAPPYTPETVRWTASWTNDAGQPAQTADAAWQSLYAALPRCVAAGGEGNTLTFEARCLIDGYTAYQACAVEIVRTPTLSNLTVSVGGVAQAVEFTPENAACRCDTTADEVTVTPTAFGDETAYAVTVDGAAVPAGESCAVTLRGEVTEIPVTVTLLGGQSRTYTLSVTKKEAVAVTLRHEVDVTVHVWNDAGAELGPSAVSDGADTFALIPGGQYTYVTDRNTYYHASAAFTAEEGLTLTAQTPRIDDAVTSLYLSTSARKANTQEICLDGEKTPFTAARHSYALSVPDAAGNLYVWVRESGYAFTAVETRRAVNQRESTAQGDRLVGFLQPGDAPQTLTLRAAAPADEAGVTFYQDYVFTIQKKLTLRDGSGVRLTVDGQAAPLFQMADGAVTDDSTFDGEVTSYQTTLPQSSLSAQMSIVPWGSAYYVYVNGVRYDAPAQADTGEQVAIPVTVPLNPDKETETILITPGSAKAGAGAPKATYVLHLQKKGAVNVAFTVEDAAHMVVADALVCVYDARTGGRIWPDESGVFTLVDTMRYQYSAACYGYVGVSETFTATQGESVRTITLTKAPPAQHGQGVTSGWPSFRGSDSANGVVDDKIPTQAEEAVLTWASKLGEGYGSNAVSCPITITEDGYDYLIVYAGSTLYKVDALSGVTVAAGAMDRSSSFAINSATYGEGMLFVGLSNGGVQAFDGATLQSLWLYTDALGGQPNCPLTYRDGYLYTGFWKSETDDAHLVCLSVTDEDPTQEKETKQATWTYTSAGGFYWAGAYVCGDYLLVGTDDGQPGCVSDTASLLCLDGRTGRLMDSLNGLCGDIRSSISYADGRFYFTSKGGYFYAVAAPTRAENGDFLFERTSLRAIYLDNYANDPANPPMSTCTPVVYGTRAYIGVSGAGQFTAYSGHNLTVLDLSAWKIAYTVPTQGYPQTSGLLTTAYGDGDGAVYVYFFDNYTPGKLRVLQDKPGQTAPVLTTEETYSSGGGERVYTTPYVIFTPADAQAQYAICSPISDGWGTLYFKNDSAYLMALGSTIEKLEIAKAPDKTTYKSGETFDPAGMELTVTYTNGLTRTLPAVRTVNGKTIPYFTWNDTVTAENGEEGFLISFVYSLYQNSADGTVGTRVSSPSAALPLTVSGTIEPTQHTLSVREDAPTAVSVRQGELYDLPLSRVFDTAGCADARFALEPGEYSAHVKLTQETDGWHLTFTEAAAGERTVTVSAVCGSEGDVTARCTLTFTVGESAVGDGGQYGYDETDADAVTVSVTVSNDGIPLVGNDESLTALAHLSVTVPYFDLSLYDLGDYARYGTTGGQGAYTGERVIRRPTALHLYIYLLERYYMGLPEEECGQGALRVGETPGGCGVSGLLDSALTYEDNRLVLNITGGPTSLYMQQFWGHDENLMYYRNHMYPLMSPGWGATADYILLSDGDTIDLAMFSNWSFWQYGAFACFDRDDYQASLGAPLHVSTRKYETKSVAEGGSESFMPVSGMSVSVYDAQWQLLGTAAGGGSNFAYTFTESGVYYLLALDPDCGTDDAAIAPATAKVTVSDRGDVNGSGKADVSDMQCLYEYLSAGTVPAGTEEAVFRALADVNGNGVVNILDYQCLYELIVPRKTGA